MKSYWKPPKEVYRGWLQTRRNLLLRKRRLRMFAIPPSSRVLDVGCGDGLNLFLLGEMGITDLTGIDRSRVAIKRAKKIVPNARFVVGDAWTLPFGNSTFDIVLVDSVFHILSLSDQPLKHIHRVLERGGYLCFVEPHGSSFRAIFDALTLSPVSTLVPFLRKRKKVLREEKELQNRWFSLEEQFPNDLVRVGFQKIFILYDGLSVIGKFKKL